MKNAQYIAGDSAWTRRHEGDGFAGQIIPFGALVSFLPSPVAKRPKMADKTLPAIFAGYHVAPGGRWKGDYLAAPLTSCKDMSHHEQVAPTPWIVSRTKEAHVSHKDPYMFPLKALCEHFVTWCS